MPTSETDYLTLSNGMQTAYEGRWCGIKNNPSVLYGYRTYANSTITVYYDFLLSTGTHRWGTFAITSNQVWKNISIDSSDAVACCFWYGGNLGDNHYVYLYFT